MNSEQSPYIMQFDPPLVLDHAERRYELLRDLPSEQKPREKLLAFGPSGLSLEELVAIVIGAGTRKEDVLSMARRLAQEYGEHTLASLHDAQQLSTDADLPLTKAEQIIASVEIGRRLFKRNQHGAQIVRTARDVFEYTKHIRDLAREHLCGIYLNAHYKVIHDEVVSIGSVDMNIVHPREVFRPGLEYAATGVILVHNHPSGELTPSEPDIVVTKQLINAGKILGIPLVDHVVVTRDGYASVPADYSA